MPRFSGTLVDEQQGGRFGGTLIGENAETQPAQEDKNFLERTGEALVERAGEVKETLQDANALPTSISDVPEAAFNLTKALTTTPAAEAAIKIKNLIAGEEGEEALSPSETRLQLVGKGIAGTTFDIIGESLVSLWETGKDLGIEVDIEDFTPSAAFGGFNLLVPDSLRDDAKEAIKQGWKDLTSSEVGEEATKALSSGTKEWMEFKEANPRQAKNIESAVNVALLFAPTKVKANAKPTALGKAAKELSDAAKKQVFQKKEQFAQRLAMPKQTKKVLEDQAKRTTVVGKGPFKKNLVQATEAEMEVAREILKVKGVSSKLSVQENLNLISAANEKLAQQLVAQVGKRRTFVPVHRVANSIDDAVSTLSKESPFLVGENSRVAARVASQAKKFLAEQPTTPLGILQARKNLDAWARSIKNTRAFGSEAGAMENAFTESLRTVRTSLNDSLATYAPSASVKRSLRRQRNLFRAIDNIAPKAAAESNTAIARLWQNATRLLPFRGTANQELALLFGIGGLGAAAKFAPWVSGLFGVSVVGHGTTKAVLSPGVKKGLSKLLRMTDRALLSSKNPSMIKQLRADRALVKKLLEESTVEKPEDEEGQ